jgi:hypothetical protein
MKPANRKPQPAIGDRQSALPIRAFQWDLARQQERLEWLIGELPRHADWGYQELYLHLEDSVEYASLPGVARPGAYRRREMDRLVKAASKAGIGVVPIVNLLGHTQYLIKVPELRDLNELRKPDGRAESAGQVCPVHPRTLEVAERLIQDVVPWCTAGKLHVGLDESFQLGRHPLSRADIARHGLAGHLSRYVCRLEALVRAHGLRLGMWADMLYFLPQAIRRLPAGIIAYDWYYHAFGRHPRVELFNFAESDLARPLQAQGIEYWGCPMNGAFRHEPIPVFGERMANIRSWWERCSRVKAGGMLVTSWEPSRLATELTSVVNAAAASHWLDRDNPDDATALSRGFDRALGSAASARTALESDRFPFSGYARWDSNLRWDLGPSDLKQHGAELVALNRIERSARSLPPAIASSIAFRRHLAERDVFIRHNAAMVFQLRRWLAAPRPSAAKVDHAIDSLAAEARRFSASHWAASHAARTLWRRTRPADSEGPNLAQLHADSERLHAWQHWLIHARRHPAMIRQATPFCGVWQLTFTVRNVCPAAQEILVEQRGPDRGWTVLHRRFTIEFLAAGARPRADIRRTFSVPVASPDCRLRIAIRGIGQVRIGQPMLTDGMKRMVPKGWAASAWKPLGRAAPRKGFPRFDRERNTAAIALEFSGK